MIEYCFESQRVYGKEPEQVTATVKMFQLILGDLPYSKIRQAFIHYLKRNSEMPTPADIFKLIEGEGKPIMDKATYIALKESMKADRYVTPDERQYIRDYEKHHVGGYTLDN